MDELYRAHPYTWEGTTASFLERVRTDIAVLEPDVGIDLCVFEVEMLVCVLTDASLAPRVRVLHWCYDSDPGVDAIPLFANCSGLVELTVSFYDHPTLDFLAGVFEAGCVAQKLTLSTNSKLGSVVRFFDALAISKVVELAVFSDAVDTNLPFEYGLCEYLQKDLLVGLVMYRWAEEANASFLCAIEWCTKLVKLELCDCKVPTWVRLPPVTELAMRCVDVGEEYDWSCLTTVRVLCVTSDSEIRGRGLSGCAQLCRALNRPDCAVRELTVGCYITQDQFEGVVWHPSCRLTKLNVNYRMDEKFERCQKLFVLLQGQQLKQFGSPLRRLPVEMIRMVAPLL